MTFEIWCIIIGVGIVVGAIVLMAVYFVKNKDKIRQDAYELEERKLNDDGLICTVHAEVINMECGVNTVGHNEPKAIKYFIITFKCDDGELLHVSVPEVFYTGLEIGLVGMLTLVDGQLKSFELDEVEA